MTKLDSVLKSKDITLPTKVHVVEAMVFSVVMYKCENWTIKKAEYQIIDAFELWCWRRLSRVHWTARRSIQSILKQCSALISFRIDWFDLLVVQGTLKSLLQHHRLKASVLQCSSFFMVQLSQLYKTTGKTIALTIWTLGLPLVAQLVKNPHTMQDTWIQFLDLEDPLEKVMATHSNILAWRIPWTFTFIWTMVVKVMYLVCNMLSRFLIAFLPRSKCILISWLQSLSAVILELKKIVCHSFLCFPFYLPESDGTRCYDLSF